ncbi:MAG: SIS domain-containing protein [Chthoniobacterales bacterium]|nr:SIS domain-containing protein [Chthoniobacterales bacterium]
MNLTEYLAEYPRLLADPEIPGLITRLKDRITEARDAGGKLMLAGNGASASIASHLATDFSKQGGVRAITFNDANLITALGNDCGYENWIAKALDFYADPKDILILISSSGKSPNVVKAAHRAKEMGLYVAAFTGFHQETPLGAAADINFWVDSRSYNIVECTHMIWLAAIVDLLIGTAEYSVSA